MCPDWQSANHINKAQGWALFKEAIEKVNTDYFSPNINCIMCEKKFSLQQGVSEAFSSDIVIDSFRHNSSESGIIEVAVGNLANIQFTQPFLDIPEINLTSYLRPVDAVSGYITSNGFAIFSSANTCSVGETRQITWHASGNRASTPIPLWRMLLSSAKDHQKNKNYRSEIVELESAFEVFMGEYLGKNLGAKLRQETINYLLKKSIEEQLSIGFTELVGSGLAKIHSREYSRWQEQVKELRDGVVHRGISVTAEQAKEARKAVFDLIVKIDNSAFEQFQIQMKDIGSSAPFFSFGTATITGKQSDGKAKVQEARQSLGVK
jgi:hypothetical protein